MKVDLCRNYCARNTLHPTFVVVFVVVVVVAVVFVVVVVVVVENGELKKDEVEKGSD